MYARYHTVVRFAASLWLKEIKFNQLWVADHQMYIFAPKQTEHACSYILFAEYLTVQPIIKIGAMGLYVVVSFIFFCLLAIQTVIIRFALLIDKMII